MKNIIIYTKNATSDLESYLAGNEEYSVRTKDVAEIADYETLNPSLIILDLPGDEIQNILMTKKFNVSVLIKSDKILDITKSKLADKDPDSDLLKPYKKIKSKTNVIINSENKNKMENQVSMFDLMQEESEEEIENKNIEIAKLTKGKSEEIEQLQKEKNEMKQKVTFGDLKNCVRNTLEPFLYQKTHHNPIVIPVILNPVEAMKKEN